MKSYLKENIAKNIAVLVVGLLSVPLINQSLSSIEATQIADILLILSILLVTVCFANFAFTYEKVNMKKTSIRLLGHGATFIFMLLMLLMLMTMCAAIKVVYPSLYVLTSVLSGLLYLGLNLYDFWDFLRADQ